MCEKPARTQSRKPLGSIMNKQLRHLGLSLIFLATVVAKSQTIDCPKDLIGTWEFFELRDKDGKHIDTLYEHGGISIQTGPTLVLNGDGTYTSQYVVGGEMDKGTWTYNKRKNEFIYKLYWRKPYDEAAKFIMTLGYAKQDENGDWYDLIPHKIVQLTSEKLIIIEKEQRCREFKKKRQ